MTARRTVAAAVALGCALLPGAAGSAAVQVDRVGSGEGLLGGSQAVRVWDAALAHTAQLLPTDDSGSVVAPSDAQVQTQRVLARLASALSAAGSSLDDVIRLNAVVGDTQSAAALQRGIERHFPAEARPSVTLVQGALPDPRALVAVDAVAVARRGAGLRTVQMVAGTASNAGAFGTALIGILPIGPRVYVSGRAADGEPAEAAADVLRQLEETLRFLRLPRSQIVQLKCFLRPVSSAPDVASAISKHFEGQAPAVVFVEWSNRQTIEIEAVAASDPALADGSVAVEYLTPTGQTASPVFSRVTRMHRPDAIYLSTLNGRTPDRGGLQIREMFADLARILKLAGSDLLHLAKATYFVSDDRTSRMLNEIRPEFFDPQRPPAASKASVPGTAVAGRSLAVDMIAAPRL